MSSKPILFLMHLRNVFVNFKILSLNSYDKFFKFFKNILTKPSDFILSLIFFALKDFFC